MNREPLPVIDLFAGPGGLGEGFASLPDQFRIALSAETDGPAHRTLRLRAFRRLLEHEGRSLDSYYDYLNGRTSHPADPGNQDLWERAGEEALQLTLGEEADDRELHRRMDRLGLGEERPWVLVGGPPCQAYSLVGRARNRAKEGYEAEKDQRHFLYKEYLKTIQYYRPAVFVMENVKGILSSRVKGERIFPKILRDLVRPDEALGRQPRGTGYRLHSLLDSDVVFCEGDDAESLPTDAFLVESERFGVPQTRHRVLILGVREDLDVMPPVLGERETPTVADVIHDLRPVRSGLSRDDSPEAWRNAVRHAGLELQREARNAGQQELAGQLGEVLRNFDDRAPLNRGGLRVPVSPLRPAMRHPELRDWLHCPRLDVCLNHEARSHMPGDLGRYLYAAVFARIHERSPVGATEFALPGLAPEHANWVSGKFADRFRVQVEDEPAKTVTSHICKDGHYYIHYRPEQCRSLTVREAARIQTFPDDYFFEGNRTQQYHQVGNAVPPWLARQVAVLVRRLIEDAAINHHVRPGSADGKGVGQEHPAASA